MEKIKDPVEFVSPNGLTENPGLEILEDATSVGLTMAEAVALSGDALPENVAIILDGALSADGEYSGIVEAGTLGEEVAFGNLVYFKAADSRWYREADASGAVKVGICLIPGECDDASVILLWGKVRVRKTK